MLGWMLKRGEHAQDADAGDTTQLDQPDTPAPVFAARAFKSALFGTPAPAGDDDRKRGSKAARKASKSDGGSGTPSKPPGILLTPGTGTSRRKRVSFDYETKSDANKAAVLDDIHDKRREAEPLKLPQKTTTRPSKTSDALADDSEGEWEEDDDDDHCAHDITVDLNEPHSQSGRYWKEEFQKYHQEAKAEMEKLLKYKQLAKSYARQKDAEAIQLAERLRDEQQKVIDMEKRISENATQIASKHRHSDKDSSDLLSKLAKQTTLAAQYRHRVQELEDELDQLMEKKESPVEGNGRRRRHMVASPNTQKTLMETQRELRRARNQLKEVDSLRKEVSTLKARAKVAEALADNGRGDAGSAAESTIQRLKAQLERSKEVNAEQTEELRQLKGDFDAFRKESEAHEADTKAVLERAHAKISDLKKEVKALKAASLSQPQQDNKRSQTGTSQVLGRDERVVDNLIRRRDIVREDTVSDEEDWRPSQKSIEAPEVQVKTRASRVEERLNNQKDPASLSALTERTNLGKPRWQPFVPRSPRNRAYLGEDVSRRARGVGATCSATQPKDISAPALPAVAAGAARIGESETTDDEAEVDLLQGRFARLGGPETNRGGGGNNNINSSMLGNTSKSSTLPADRRAAALTRIKERMAEKKRSSSRRSGYDKENLRP